MIRLDKMISHLGYGSRKECKELIRKGFVLVNGEEVYDDDFKVDELNDEVVIADNVLDYSEFVYLMLNKPDGYVSATFDNYDPTVLDLIEGYEKRNLFPVGRLDKDTVGLLILTNDGQLAHKLLAPKSHVDKKYYLKYEGKLPGNYQRILAEGVTLDDGYKCMPAELTKINDGEAYIIIKEGKFHQVKRMLAAMGCNVTYLERVEFGSLVLDKSLERGEYRELSLEELEELKK